LALSLFLVISAAAGMFLLGSVLLWAAFQRRERAGTLPPGATPSPHGSPVFRQAPIPNFYSSPPVGGEEPQYEELASSVTTPETVVITPPPAPTPTARPLRRSSRIAARRVPYRRPERIEEEEDESNED